MNLINEYLSDDELEQLILDVEQNELVTAPPDLLDNILAGIENEQTGATAIKVNEQSQESKILEFRKYRFRVWTSVAAAVAMVFFLPKLMDLQQPETRQPGTQSAEVSAKQVFVLQGRYETKEEALNDTGILTEVFGGVNIFDNEDKFNFFNG